MNTLFNLISFFALLCAFNFAYAGVTRFREILVKDILRTEELLRKIKLMVSADFDFAKSRPEKESIEQQKKRKYLANELQISCSRILRKRKFHNEFENKYIELFFSGGCFCAFQVFWISFYHTVDKELFLIILSYSYLIILPMLYIILSASFPVFPLPSTFNNILAIFIIYAISIICIFLIEASGNHPAYFSEKMCIFLSIIIGLLPYIIFFCKVCFHLNNNRKAYNKCLQLTLDKAIIDNDFRRQLSKTLFKK